MIATSKANLVMANKAIFGGVTHRHACLVLTFLTLACLSPFAAKAFHMDDPLFLWTAQQIRSAPLNPYGFQVNWYESAMPMAEVTKNPPLACYYIALIGSIFGQRELQLHLAFVLPALGAVLGSYALASRLCRNPLAAAMATLLTPVFLVSSTNIMCDTMMLAFWIWSIVFWLRGLERGQSCWLVFAGVFIGICALTKYFGAALIPLLAVYSLAKAGRAGWSLLYLLIPVAMLALYECATRVLYGHGLLLEAFAYVRGTHAHDLASVIEKIVTTFSFVGGGFAIIVCLSPFLCGWKLWTGSLFAVVALAIVSSPLKLVPGQPDHPLGILFTSQWSIFVIAGIAMLAIAIADYTYDRSPESLLLLLWIFGTFVFCLINWTINGRSVEPMGPAIAIILLRRIERTRCSISALPLAAALGVAALISFLVSYADYRWADSARKATVEIKRTLVGPRNIWFQGHWGFQWYAEAEGLSAFDARSSQISRGDLMILPLSNANSMTLQPGVAESAGEITVPTCRWLTTMNGPLGAGFYSDVWGPLPYVLASVPPDTYRIVQFR